MQRLHVALPFAVTLCTCTRQLETRAAHAGPLGTINSLRPRRSRAALPARSHADRVLDGVPIRDGVPVPSLDPLTRRGDCRKHKHPRGLLSSPRASIRVHALRSVSVRARPWSTSTCLMTGIRLKQPVSRLSGKWTLRGAQSDRAKACGLQYPPRCSGLGALHRAECRVSAALDWARQERDVVLARCRDAKLTAMREAILRADAGEPDAAATIFRLEREAFECIGEEHRSSAGCRRPTASCRSARPADAAPSLPTNERGWLTWGRARWSWRWWPVPGEPCRPPWVPPTRPPVGPRSPPR